jgi:hypothetical protein
MQSHPFILSVTTTYPAHEEGKRSMEETARLTFSYFDRLSRSSAYGRVISVK